MVWHCAGGGAWWGWDVGGDCNVGVDFPGTAQGGPAYGGGTYAGVEEREPPTGRTGNSGTQVGRTFSPVFPVLYVVKILTLVPLESSKVDKWPVRAIPPPRIEGKMQPKEWYHSLIRVADLLCGIGG